MTMTVLARNGFSLGYDHNIDGWLNFCSGADYSTEQLDRVTRALMNAQRAEFDAMLPAGCHWSPATSEVIGPVGTDLDELVDADTNEALVDAAMRLAGQRVIDRFDDLEQEALQQ